MNKFDFELTFKRMCGNYSKDPEGLEDKSVALFKRFQRIHTRDFNKAVDLAMENSDYFPTISKINKALKKCYGDSISKDYPYCRACNNSPAGLVTMILSFKEIEDHNNPGGPKTIKIDEKHHWSIEKQGELHNNRSGRKYYCYSFACRCERGMDYHNARGGVGHQLSPDEYKELLEAGNENHT